MDKITIERTVGYKVGQQFFTTVFEAQCEAIKAVIGQVQESNSETVAERIVNSAAQVIAILSEKPEPQPRKRRSDYGTKRNGSRRAAVNAAVQDMKQ